MMDIMMIITVVSIGTPSCMVAALLSQKQSSVSPRTRGSNGNYTGACGLRGCFPSSIALGGVSRSILSSSGAIRYVLIGT